MSQSSLPPACLYIEDHGHTYRVSLGIQVTTIGASTRADVILKDPGAAQIAARVLPTTRGYELEIQGNVAAWLNGRREVGTRPLVHGDVLNIGESTLRFFEVAEVSDTVIQLGIVGPEGEQSFILTDQSLIRIGESVGEVRIADPEIANPHLAIENLGSDASFVRQLQGDVLTRLNGKKLKERTRLKDGDSIEIGGTRLVVRLYPGQVLPAPEDVVFPVSRDRQITNPIPQVKFDSKTMKDRRQSGYGRRATDAQLTPVDGTPFSHRMRTLELDEHEVRAIRASRSTDPPDSPRRRKEDRVTRPQAPAENTELPYYAPRGKKRADTDSPQDWMAPSSTGSDHTGSTMELDADELQRFERKRRTHAREEDDR